MTNSSVRPLVKCLCTPKWASTFPTKSSSITKPKTKRIEGFQLPHMTTSTKRSSETPLGIILACTAKATQPRSSDRAMWLRTQVLMRKGRIIPNIINFHHLPMIFLNSTNQWTISLQLAITKSTTV